MCIRDRFEAVMFPLTDPVDVSSLIKVDYDDRDLRSEAPAGCLLYTSDAADERSSVDLGGRRIIKKKNEENCSRYSISSKNTIHRVREQRAPTSAPINTI